jgi:hypothetical protein
MNRIDLEGSGATSVLAESYCLITDRSRMLFGGQPCVHGRKRAGLVLIWGRLFYIDALRQIKQGLRK